MVFTLLFSLCDGVHAPSAKWIKFVIQDTWFMTYFFEPFTPEAFHQHTGLTALDNEAVYLRWVNSQINYANYQQMQTMNTSLKEIITLLKEGSLAAAER